MPAYLPRQCTEGVAVRFHSSKYVPPPRAARQQSIHPTAASSTYWLIAPVYLGDLETLHVGDGSVHGQIAGQRYGQVLGAKHQWLPRTDRLRGAENSKRFSAAE